jgi:hypothetical protein
MKRGVSGEVLFVKCEVGATSHLTPPHSHFTFLLGLGVPLGQMRLGSRLEFSPGADPGLQFLGGFVPQPPAGFSLQSLARNASTQVFAGPRQQCKH